MSNLLTVYIDEAGDPGVRDGLKYYDTRHEWLCLAAYVVRTSNDGQLVEWVRELRSAANSRQAGALHYHRITAERRQHVCETLAQKPARAFVVASHKSNMREYVNPRIGTKLAADKFYNWAFRLLLERVTEWGERWLLENAGAVEPLRLIMAGRGGHDYDHLFSYIDLLRMQVEARTLFLKGKGLHPTLLDRTRWKIAPAETMAGLQLADTVVSAFGQAVNSASPSYDIEPAKALRPILAADKRGCVADKGLMALPFRHQGTIPEPARPIFEHYGFKW